MNGKSVGEATPAAIGARQPVPAAVRRSKPPEAEKISEKARVMQARDRFLRAWI
jgi:hypothetical protein